MMKVVVPAFIVVLVFQLPQRALSITAADYFECARGGATLVAGECICPKGNTCVGGGGCNNAADGTGAWQPQECGEEGGSKGCYCDLFKQCLDDGAYFTDNHRSGDDDAYGFCKCTDAGCVGCGYDDWRTDTTTYPNAKCKENLKDVCEAGGAVADTNGKCVCPGLCTHGSSECATIHISPWVHQYWDPDDCKDCKCAGAAELEECFKGGADYAVTKNQCHCSTTQEGDSPLGACTGSNCRGSGFNTYWTPGTCDGTGCACRGYKECVEQGAFQEEYDGQCMCSASGTEWNPFSSDTACPAAGATAKCTAAAGYVRDSGNYLDPPKCYCSEGCAGDGCTVAAKSLAYYFSLDGTCEDCACTTTSATRTTAATITATAPTSTTTTTAWAEDGLRWEEEDHECSVLIAHAFEGK
eukprot:gene23208-10739_t